MPLKHPLHMALLALTLCAACQDEITQPAAGPTPSARLLATVTCEVEVESGVSRCEEASPASRPAGPRYYMVPDGQWIIRTGTSSYTPADSTFRLPVRFLNYYDSIGSPDGIQITGVKVFLTAYEGVTATGVRVPPAQNRVWPRNSDGRMAFTAPDQPFWTYAQMVGPGYSGWREWQFTLAPDVKRVSFTAGIFAFTPGETLVPAIPPDSIADSLYSVTKLVKGDSADSGWFLRDIALVAFKNGASAEQRLAALNGVDGVVVGGRPVGTSGFFFVRVPDDGTARNLHKAIDQLRTLPQVAWASPEYMTPTEAPAGASFRSEDGSSGWHRGDWRLSADTLLDQPNWGLEAIQAPYAWGCTTGDSAVSIGVVDEGFVEHPDIENATYTNLTSAGPSPAHGGLVSSILAANGNNGSGIAGTIWKSELTGYSVKNEASNLVEGSGLYYAFWKAIADGNRVINLSRQTVFIKEPGETLGYDFRRPDQSDTRDMQKAFLEGMAIAGIMSLEVIEGFHDPLVVIAAGNQTVRAEFSGYTQAAILYPNRVIVVGAASRAEPGTGDYGGPVRFARWADTLGLQATASGSNYGSLVDLYAPGTQVGGLFGYNSPDRRNGTSLAAPYVAGVAGLMLSLDPRLTPAELKALILKGAERGNRRVINGIHPNDPSKYLLNAYESLRAVAERPGAGLCGNEMYKDSTGAVFAARRTGPTASTVSWEQIFTDGVPSSPMSVQHVERSVRKGDGITLFWRDRSFLSGASWGAESTLAPADNATYFSRLGRSHDGDSVATVTRRQTSETEEWYDIVFPNGSLASIKGPAIRIPTTPAPQRCVKWDLNSTEFGNCHASAIVRPDYRTSTFSYAYSSARREVVIAVARDSLAQTVDLNADIIAGYWQRSFTIDNYTLGTDFYFIPVDQPSAYRTVSIRGRRYDNVAFSDDGRSLALRGRTANIFNTHTPEVTYSSKVINCQARFASINRVAANYSLTFGASAPLMVNYSFCHPDQTFAG